jgi:hypothetical protein
MSQLVGPAWYEAPVDEPVGEPVRPAVAALRVFSTTRFVRIRPPTCAPGYPPKGATFR